MAPRKAGEVWEIDHGRKGRMSIRLLKDVEDEDDTFVEAVILDGTARYMAEDAREAGESLTMRVSLVRWIKKVKPPTGDRKSVV